MLCYLGNRATFSCGGRGRRGLVHSECKEMYSYLFTEAELESCLLECQRRLHMYSANVRTDSLLMFAAVKLRLVKASARFHRWMISIRTEREKEASIGELLSLSLSSL